MEHPKGFLDRYETLQVLRKESPQKFVSSLISNRPTSGEALNLVLTIEAQLGPKANLAATENHAEILKIADEFFNNKTNSPRKNRP